MAAPALSKISADPLTPPVTAREMSDTWRRVVYEFECREGRSSQGKTDAAAIRWVAWILLAIELDPSGFRSWSNSIPFRGRTDSISDLYRSFERVALNHRLCSGAVNVIRDDYVMDVAFRQIELAVAYPNEFAAFSKKIGRPKHWGRT